MVVVVVVVVVVAAAAAGIFGGRRAELRNTHARAHTHVEHACSRFPLRHHADRAFRAAWHGVGAFVGFRVELRKLLRWSEKEYNLTVASLQPGEVDPYKCPPAPPPPTPPPCTGSNSGRGAVKGGRIGGERGIDE